MNEIVLSVFLLDWTVPPKVPEAGLAGDECRSRPGAALPISPCNDSQAEKRPSIIRGVLLSDDGLSGPCRISGVMALSAVCVSALSGCSWGSPSVPYAHLIWMEGDFF